MVRDLGISSGRLSKFLSVTVTPRCLHTTCLRVVRTLISIRFRVPLERTQTFPSRVNVQFNGGTLLRLVGNVIVPVLGNGVKNL